MMAMQEAGMDVAGGFLGSKPDIPSFIMDVYEGYHECDRDMNGNLTFVGMNAVLDHYEFPRHEWSSVRSVWREMDRTRRDKREELKADEPPPEDDA